MLRSGAPLPAVRDLGLTEPVAIDTARAFGDRFETEGHWRV